MQNLFSVNAVLVVYRIKHHREVWHYPGVPAVPLSPGTTRATGRWHSVCQVPHQGGLDHCSLHGAAKVVCLKSYTPSKDYQSKKAFSLRKSSYISHELINNDFSIERRICLYFWRINFHFISGLPCLWMNSPSSTSCLRTRQQPFLVSPKHVRSSTAVRILLERMQPTGAPSPEKAKLQEALGLMTM